MKTTTSTKKFLRCPQCGELEYLDIDLHSDGWAIDWVECEKCGATWSIKKGRNEY